MSVLSKEVLAKACRGPSSNCKMCQHSRHTCAVWQPDQWPAVHDVEPQIGQVTQRPEVVDDFIRNFLVKMGLSKTLEMFETEW